MSDLATSSGTAGGSPLAGQPARPPGVDAARIAARIAVFARDGHIPAEKFDRALAVFPGAVDARALIVAELGGRGVFIDQLAVTSDPSLYGKDPRGALPTPVRPTPAEPLAAIKTPDVERPPDSGARQSATRTITPEARVTFDPRVPATDSTLILRMASAAARFANDGALTLKKFELVLNSFPGGMLVRTAVERELSDRGVTVSSQPVGRPTPADGACIASTAAPSRGTTRRSAPAAHAEAVSTARRLLEADQAHHSRKMRVLTAEEEVGLAVLIRERQDLATGLSSGYRRTLVEGSEAARAFDAMVLHNVRLVWKIAAKFVPRAVSQGDSLEYEDLAQAGMAGLIRAVELFDATQGHKFSTYATHWIQQSVGREIDNCGRSIRLPVHVLEDLRRLQGAIEAIRMRGDSPTSIRIADLVGMDETKVTRYLDYLRRPASLNLMIGDDGDTSLEDFVTPNQLDTPEHAYLEGERTEQIEDVMWGHLDPRSVGVLMHRVGWDDNECKTLDDIGKIYGVTRERIRQIEAKALGVLRTPACKRALGSGHADDLWDGFDR